MYLFITFLRHPSPLEKNLHIRSKCGSTTDTQKSMAVIYCIMMKSTSSAARRHLCKSQPFQEGQIREQTHKKDFNSVVEEYNNKILKTYQCLLIYWSTHSYIKENQCTIILNFFLILSYFSGLSWCLHNMFTFLLQGYLCIQLH